MSRTVEVRLNFTAETSSAEQALNKLQSSLRNITNQQNLDLGGYKLSNELNQASEAAIKLRQNLQNALNVNTNSLDLTKFNREMQKSGMSLEKYRTALVQIGPSGQAAFADLAKAIVASESPLTRSLGLLDKLWDTLKRTAGWQISSNIMHGLQSGLSDAYNYAKDLNKSLNDIRIVTGYSADRMADFAKQANKAAKELSATTLDYTDASLIYYQQGLDDKAVKERTDTTIKMANVTGTTAQTVSQQMTAVWENFMKNGEHAAEYYADVMTALGAATASSTDEIADGLEKFAAVADTVGLSYEYATAALTTITAKTRQSADVVGTALKTLFARIEGLNLGETLDDGTTLNKYSSALEAVGVNIKDEAGQLKDMDEILDEIGSKWDTIGKDQQIALAQTVAGVRQYTQFVALMDNWDFMGENLATAYGAEGTLDEQQKIYEESWEAARNRLQASMETLYDDLLKDDFFIWLTDALSDVVGLIDKIIDSMGGLAGLLPGLILLMNKLWGDKIAAGISTAAYNIGGLIPSVRQARNEADQQLREQAMSNLQSMYQAQGNATGTAVVDVYAQINKLQQYRLNNADKLTAQESQQLSLLIDQARVEAEMVENMAKQVDAGNQQAKIAERSLYLSSNVRKDKVTQFEGVGQLTSNWLKMSKEEWSQDWIKAIWGNNSTSFDTEKTEITSLIQELGGSSISENDISKFLNGKRTGKNKELQKIFKRIQSYSTEDLGQARYYNDLIYGINGQGGLENYSKLQGKLDTGSEQLQAILARVPDISGETLDSDSWNVLKNELQGLIDLLGEAGVKTTALQKTLDGLSLDDPSEFNDDLPALIEMLSEGSRDKKGNIISSGFQQATEDNLERIRGLEEKLAKQFNLSTKDLEVFRNELIKTGSAEQALKKALEAASAAAEIQDTALKRFTHTLTALQKVQNAVNLASSLTMGISSFKSAIDTISNPDLSAWDKFTSILMSASMVLGSFLPILNSVKTIYTDLKFAVEAEAAAQAMSVSMNEAAAVVKNKNALAVIFEKEATGQLSREEAIQNIQKLTGIKITDDDTFAHYKDAAAKLQEATATDVLTAAMQRLGAVISKYKAFILIAAAIAIAVQVSKMLKDAMNATQDAAEAAQENATSLANAYNEAKTAYNELTTAWDNYNTAKDNLKELTEGTIEYTDAVREANEAALQLINNYDGIKYTIGTDGLIELDEDSVLVARQEESKRLLQQQTVAQSAKLNAAAAQTDVDIETTAGKMHTASDIAPTANYMAEGAVGGAMAGALAGAALGSIVPVLGNVVGALGGALIGSVLGVIGTGLTIADNGGMASKDEVEVIKELAKADKKTWAEIQAAQAQNDDQAFAKAVRSIDGLADISDGMLNALDSQFDAVSDNVTALQANTAALRAWFKTSADGINSDNDYYNSLSDADQQLAASIRAGQITQEDIDKEQERIEKNYTDKAIAEDYFEKAGYDPETQTIEKNEDGDWVLRTQDAAGNWNDGFKITADEMAEYLAKYNVGQATEEAVGKQLAAYQQVRANLADNNVNISDEDRDNILQHYADTGEWDFTGLSTEVADAFADAIKQTKAFIPERVQEGINYRNSDQGERAYQDSINQKTNDLSDEYGVTTGYIEEQTAAIMANNKAYANNQKAALDLVESQLKAQVALDTASEEFKNNKQVLSDWAKGLDKSLEAQKKVNSFKKSLKELFGIQFSDDFLIENFETIQAALEGDEEAYKRLQKLAAKQVVLDIKGASSVDELPIQLQGLYNLIELMPDLEVGATLDDSGFKGVLEQLLADGQITVDDMNAILSGIGFTPDVSYVEIPTDQASAFIGSQEQEVLVPNDDGGYDKKTITTKNDLKAIGADVIRIPIIGNLTKDQQSAIKSGGGKIIANATFTGKGSTGNLSSSSSGGGGGGSKKDKKKASDEIERYHVVKQQLNRLSSEYDQLSAAKDRAYGPDKLKAIDNEIAKLQEQEAIQKRYLDEINRYYQQDRQAIAKYGAVFDANGIITNYDALMQKQLDIFNASLTDEAEEAYNTFKETLDQYEETLALKLEEAGNLLDKQYEIVSAKLEKITYKVEYKVEIEEDKLDYLERRLTRLSEVEKASLEVFAINQEKIMSYWSQYAIYAEAIRGIEAQINEQKAKGLEITDEQIQKLRDYKKALGEMEDNIYELYNDEIDSISDRYNNLFDQLENYQDRIRDYRDSLETIKDMYSLLGVATVEDNRAMNDSIRKTYQAEAKGIQSEIDLLKARREELDKSRSSLGKSVDEQGHLIDGIVADIRKLENVGDLTIMEDSALAYSEKLQDQIDEIDQQVHEKQMELISLASDYLNAIKDQWVENLELIGQKTKDALYEGLEWAIDKYGDLTDLSELYLSNTRKVYELNKLNRNIQADINKLDSVVAKTKLRDLMKDINGYYADNVKMSEYELKNLQAQYELRLAEIALEDARNAKSEVRLTRDNEGRWGYMYTANTEEVDKAEQELEDKQYALQELQEDTLKDAGEKILSLQNDYIDAMTELQSSDLSDEQKQKRAEELTSLYQKQLDYYYQTYAQALEASGLAYEETILGQATNTKSLQEVMETFGHASIEMTGQMISETQKYQDAFTQMVSDITGKQINSYEEAQKAWVEYMSNTQKSLNEATTNATNNFNEVAKAIREMSEDFRDMIEELMVYLARLSGEDMSLLFYSALANGDYEMAERYAKARRQKIDSNPDAYGEYDWDKDKMNQIIDEKQDKNNPMSQDERDAILSTAKTPYIKKTDWGTEMEKALQAGNYDDAGLYAEYRAYKVHNDASLKAVAWSEAQLQEKINQYAKDPNEMSAEQKRRILATASQYDTGGYTGSWGNEGRWALLHEKELVLNKNDTSNLLTTITLLHDLMARLDQASVWSALRELIPASAATATEILEQNVHIEASFPNAVDHNEIEQAFENIVNLASQYANRK